MDLKSSLLALADRYCEATKLSRARVSTLIANDGKFLGRIEGKSGFTISTFERAVQWFSDHWPADTAWPEGVTRPAPANASEAAA